MRTVWHPSCVWITTWPSPTDLSRNPPVKRAWRAKPYTAVEFLQLIGTWSTRKSGPDFRWLSWPPQTACEFLVPPQVVCRWGLHGYNVNVEIPSIGFGKACLNGVGFGVLVKPDLRFLIPGKLRADLTSLNRWRDGLQFPGLGYQGTSKDHRH